MRGEEVRASGASQALGTSVHYLPRAQILLESLKQEGTCSDSSFRESGGANHL